MPAAPFTAALMALAYGPSLFGLSVLPLCVYAGMFPMGMCEREALPFFFPYLVFTLVCN